MTNLVIFIAMLAISYELSVIVYRTDFPHKDEKHSIRQPSGITAERIKGILLSETHAKDINTVVDNVKNIKFDFALK